MVSIDPKDKKYIITFKRKDLRPNQRDDKIAIFRHVVGLDDVRDIVDISSLTGSHMEDSLNKTRSTVTDINSYETPFVFARLSLDQVARLRKDPNVEFVEEEIFRKIAEETRGWQIGDMYIEKAWAAPLSVRGAGVNVAIIDTGCHTHIDFGSNLKINQNFTSRSGTVAEDPNRHGTHVAGICGAVEGNNEGIQGVAPSCNLWNLRAGDHQGLLSTADMIEAHQYATQNNAHVVNMSVAGGPFSQAEQNAITTGFNSGIVYVAAAGNTGQQESANYPSSYPGVISISNLYKASDDFDDLHSTSSYGSYVDFCAPGSDIVSLAENNGYRNLTGTSMACPAVSGIVALMLSAYNDTGCPPYTTGARKNQVIEKVLIDTAEKNGLTTFVATKFGNGRPRANMAVASLKGVLPSALA